MALILISGRFEDEDEDEEEFGASFHFVRWNLMGSCKKMCDKQTKLASKCRVVKRAKLIVASSEASADMLYATRFRAPDAFAFVGTKERTAVLLSDLEVDRGRREAMVDDVVSYSELEKAVQGAKKKKPAYAKVLARFLKSRDVRRVLTPVDFPLGLARALKKENIRVQPADALFWPSREIKNAQEIEALGAALR
ncbi:MAG: hypothetical protein WBL40_17385, partial [Terrimicrobiaceae bacterium]